MRITNGMIVTNVLRDITRNQERMDALNKNLSTGKKFLKPSDDPLGVSRSLRLNTDISTMSQFKRNLDDSQSWIDSTETATDNIISVMQRARELALQAKTGTNATPERAAVSSEIAQLKEQLIHVGNTSYAGSYLFSGYKTDQPLLKADGTYDLGGGELSNKEVMNVNMGIGDQFGLNFVGQRIFGVIKSDGDIDSPISQGVHDFVLKAETDPTDPISVTATTPTLSLDYGSPAVNYQVNVPAGSYTPASFAAAVNSQINSDPTLVNLKKHVSVNTDSGFFNLVSDKDLALNIASQPGIMTQMGMNPAKNVASKENYTIKTGTIDFTTKPVNMSAGNNNSMDIVYGSAPPITVNVVLNASVYDGIVPNDINGVATQIQNALNAAFTANGTQNGVKVQVEDGKLVFNSDMPLTVKNAALNSADLGGLGLYNGATAFETGDSVKSGEKTQLIGVFDQLIADLASGDSTKIGDAIKRLDSHLDNINAVRAEIGVKSNRLELTSNRIDDDTLNLQTLLSENEDADMAEVIMNLKMEENVYKASLSGGAKIIQPSLLDFLR